MPSFLAAGLFLPIVLSPLPYVVSSRSGKRPGGVTFLILLVTTLLVLLAALQAPNYLEAYPWQPIGEFGLRLDGLSAPFAGTVVMLSAVIAVYSIPYMKHRIEDQAGHDVDDGVMRRRLGLYFTLYLLYVGGMLGTVLATNLIQLYLFFELMLVPSYFLISEYGYGERYRISVMYFIWTHLGALALLAGLLTIGLRAKSFDMAAIVASSLPSDIALWVGIAVTVGLFVKLAAVGLHVWLPHAHAEAPTPISALLSPVMIGIGAYVFVRVVSVILPTAYETLSLAVAVWGVATMAYGALMALAQDDLKRLLAYSSISQMGYIIFGLSTLHPDAVSGSVLQYVSHGTGKAVLFMTAGIVILQANGLRSISRMGGLAPKLPVTAVSAIIGFLTIMGVPPLIGFQSKWILFSGALAGASRDVSPAKMLITVLALLATLLTLAYCLYAIKRIFFGRLPSELEGIEEAHPLATVPLLTLAIISVVIGLQPGLITENLVPLLRAQIGV